MKETRVRPYELADAEQLALVHGISQPDHPVSRNGFGSWLQGVKHSGGTALVLTLNGMAQGYALAAPLPGLNGIFEIDGAVSPGNRRRGFGSVLWHHLRVALSSDTDLLVTYRVTSLDSVAARFLFKQGFSVEHRELVLELTLQEQLPLLQVPSHTGFITMDRRRAASHFRRLYEQAFSGLPWFQPYESDNEVLRELDDGADMIFLASEGVPVGFAWLRWTTPELGEIEPVGLAPGFREKGLGRLLVLKALHQFAAAGCRAVRLGVWSQNRRAIRTYQQLGFEHVFTFTHLGYTIEVAPGL